MKHQGIQQRFLCAVAFATLGIVSLPSSAHSGEYARSYEQGYPDEYERQNHHKDYSRRTPYIRIEEARYGLRGASCDARRSLQAAVGSHRHVSVAINNNLCGDPVPGVQKRIRITYSCDNGEVFELRVPERDVATLYCR